MAKYINPSAQDAALTFLRDNATHYAVATAQSTTAGQYAVGTCGVGTADWTLGAGDVSGRKITLAAKNIVIGTSGSVDHVAVYNSGTLLAVGTCATTAVTAGGTAAVAAFDIWEINNP